MSSGTSPTKAALFAAGYVGTLGGFIAYGIEYTWCQFIVLPAMIIGAVVFIAKSMDGAKMTLMTTLKIGGAVTGAGVTGLSTFLAKGDLPNMPWESVAVIMLTLLAFTGVGIFTAWLTASKMLEQRGNYSRTDALKQSGVDVDGSNKKNELCGVEDERE